MKNFNATDLSNGGKDPLQGARRAAARFLVFILLYAAGYATYMYMRDSAPDQPRVRDGVAMDTLVSIQIYSVKYNAAADEILDGAFSLITDLENELSVHNPNSAVSRVNELAGTEPLAVSRGLFELLGTATKMAELTGGAFTPAIGALTSLWREAGENPPSEAQIVRARELSDWRDVSLISPDKVFLRRRGAALDLGGIAKGYASGKVRDYLESREVTSAIIDMGGNIVTIGGNARGGAWRIGIQRPSGERGDALCSVETRDVSVITAGVYERHFDAGGLYTHIIDPGTGRPVSGDLLSATLITDDPTVGDALSTAFMVMGTEKALSFIKDNTSPRAEAVFISRDGDNFKVTATDGVHSLKIINHAKRR